MGKGGEKLVNFESQFLADREFPIYNFGIYGSHMSPLLARQRTGPGALGLK